MKKKWYKAITNKIRPFYWFIYEYFYKVRFEILLKLNGNSDIKIVVGSSGLFDKGWLPTEVNFLDLSNKSDWNKYFKENTISNIFAEHVWEHLTPAQGILAVKNFLKKGGVLRIAVPDRYNSDDDCINYVKVGGYGYGADDHKILYNFESLSEILNEAGFEVNLIEYFNKQRKFKMNYNDLNNGRVLRSKGNLGGVLN